MRAIRHPTPDSITGDLLPLRFLVATRLDVGGVSQLAEQPSHVRVALPLSAHRFCFLRGVGFRPIDRNALQGLRNQLLVMRVGATDRHAQRDTRTLGKRNRSRGSWLMFPVRTPQRQGDDCDLEQRNRVCQAPPSQGFLNILGEGLPN